MYFPTLKMPLPNISTPYSLSTTSPRNHPYPPAPSPSIMYTPPLSMTLIVLTVTGDLGSFPNFWVVCQVRPLTPAFQKKRQGWRSEKRRFN
jgi:hypothetical protein